MRIALLAAAFLVACHAPAPAPLPLLPPAADAPVETREVQLDDDFITVRLHIPATAEARKPTVISMLGNRAALLEQGFLVVTFRINWEVRRTPPPAPASDNAVGKWVLASPSADVLGRPYLGGIVETATVSVPKIIDWLETVPEVDPHRLGIIGSSSNGFLALQATAHDRRLTTAAVLAACGDYHTFLRDSSMGMEGQPLRLAPDYERWLRAQEAIRHPARLLHAAVLLVNRNHDLVIPYACAARTAAVLTRTYARAGRPERFRFVTVDSDRHGLDQRDVEQAIAWLVRWLRPAAGSAR